MAHLEITAQESHNIVVAKVHGSMFDMRDDRSSPRSGTLFIDAIDVHTSPSSRAHRVLASKRPPTRADHPQHENAPEDTDTRGSDASTHEKHEEKASLASPTSFAGRQSAEPKSATMVRRRSSGHIVVSARRSQLFSSTAATQNSALGTLTFGSRPANLLKTSVLSDLGSSTLEIMEIKCEVYSEELLAVHEVAKGINAGFQADIPPIPVEDCTGGVYYFRNRSKRIAAVFKPSDEEPYAPNHPKQYRRSPTEKSSPLLRSEDNRGNVCLGAMLDSKSGTESMQSGIRAGIAPGGAAIREVAAYLLDRDHSAGVPISVLATAAHPAFHYAKVTPAPDQRPRKVGALQMYISHKCTADDIASSLFSAADVHAIAVLDIRLANQDRHGGNILVLEQAKRVFKLVPIDHGACLPRVCEMEETTFEWLYWSQAKCAFRDDTRAYIASLNSWEDAKMLRRTLPSSHQLEEQAILTLHVCTALLQVCVLEWNMNAHDIGMLMCRHGGFAAQQQQESDQSVLEKLVAKSQEDAADNMRKPKTSDLAGHEERSMAMINRFKRHLNEFLTYQKLK